MAAVVERQFDAGEQPVVEGYGQEAVFVARFHLS